MPGRYPLYFLIGASLCVAVPALAASVDGPRLTHFPTGVVHAGDTIDLAWTRPAGEVEEFEVVLSVDGGARYTIRVTPELARYREHFTWKVPAIDAAHARLSVRYGEERDEQLGAPTPEFAIVRAREAGTAPEVRSAWVTNATQQPLDWWDEADAAPLAPTGPALSGDATLVARHRHIARGHPPAPRGRGGGRDRRPVVRARGRDTVAARAADTAGRSPPTLYPEARMMPRDLDLSLPPREDGRPVVARVRVRASRDHAVRPAEPTTVFHASVWTRKRRSPATLRRSRVLCTSPPRAPDAPGARAGPPARSKSSSAHVRSRVFRFHPCV